MATKPLTNSWEHAQRILDNLTLTTMLSDRVCKIPPYLHSSVFYHSLHENEGEGEGIDGIGMEDDEPISIPKFCMKFEHCHT